MTVVAFQEGAVWIAQALEYDICVSDPDRTNLRHKMNRAIISNIAVNDHLGRVGLEGIPPAPAHFADMPRL